MSINIVDTENIGSASYSCSAGEHDIAFSKNLKGISITGSQSNGMTGQFMKIKRLGVNFENFMDRCFSNLAIEELDLSEADFIPDHGKALGRETFADCKNLKTVYISRNQIKIGNRMFAGCSSLSCMEPGDYMTASETKLACRLQEVGQQFAAGCTALKYLAFPESLTTASRISPAALNGCSVVKLSFPGVTSETAVEDFVDRITQTDCFGLNSNCDIVFGSGSSIKLYRFESGECVEIEDAENGYKSYIAGSAPENPQLDTVYFYDQTLVEKCNNENLAYCVIVSDCNRSPEGMKFISEILEESFENTISEGYMYFLLWDGNSASLSHLGEKVKNITGERYPRMLFKYKDICDDIDVSGKTSEQIKQIISEEYSKMHTAGWDYSSSSGTAPVPDMTAEDYDDNMPVFVLCSMEGGDFGNPLQKMYYENDVFEYAIKQKFSNGINPNNITRLSDNPTTIKNKTELRANKKNFIDAINKYKNARNLIIFYSDHGSTGGIHCGVKRKDLWNAIKDRSKKDLNNTECAQTFVMMCCCHSRSMIGDPDKIESAAPILFWSQVPSNLMGYANHNLHGGYSPNIEHDVTELMEAFMIEFDPNKTYAQIWENIKSHDIKGADWINKKQTKYETVMHYAQQKVLFGNFDESKKIFT